MSVPVKGCCPLIGRSDAVYAGAIDRQTGGQMTWSEEHMHRVTLE